MSGVGAVGVVPFASEGGNPALACHPDRFSDKGDAEKKEAERKFKELGEALDILTDEFKRKLWDEGHDQESISQQVAQRAQQQQPGR